MIRSTLCVVGAACMHACSGAPESAAAKSAPSASAPSASAQMPSADFVRVDSMAITEAMRIPATVYVEQDAVVSARANGLLRALTVDLGSRVTAGQLLGRLDDDLQRLAVARADVELARATRVVNRARAMRSSDNIPVNELEDAEDALNLAAVTKREAEAALERTAVIAPFDGVVSGRYVRPGRLLSMNDTIVRITSGGPPLSRLRAPEREAAALRVGTTIRARRSDGRAFDARVTRIAPAIDAASGTREIIVQLPGNSGLLPGTALSMALPSAGRRALAVPKSAVSDGDFVIVAEGRRTVMRPVMRGVAFGDFIELRAGVTAGERVRRITR